MEKHPDKFEARLSRMLLKAKVNLVLERLWVSMRLFFCTFLVFLGASYAGLWENLAGWVHSAGLAVFAGAGIYGYYRLWVTFQWPEKQDVLKNLETRNAATHRPLQTLEAERVSDNFPNSTSEHLWSVHLARQRRIIAQMKAGFPSLGLSEGDHWSLRSAAILVLIAGFFMAGPLKSERFIGAFNPYFISENDLVELDIWLTPPDYTGKPPILLARQKTDQINDQIQTVSAPDKSQLVARISGGSDDVPILTYLGKISPFTAVEGQNFELETVLSKSGDLLVKKNGDTLGQWQLALIPDKKPIVKLLTLPEVTDRLAFRLQYSAVDDYGLTRLSGRITRTGQDKELNLKMPLVPGLKETKGKSYHDLTAHPWAGFDVNLQIVTEDAIGQKGISGSLIFTLPERKFTHPIAQALIEQRKKLVADPVLNKRDVILALSAIGLLPASLNNDFTVRLMVSVGRSVLIHGRGQSSVDEVIDILWDTALRLENGDLGAAEAALREAESALMEALNKDTPNAEIKRLVEELKSAMNNFLEALAKQQGDQAEASDPNAQTLDQRNLQNLLDRVDQLARSGARDAARELLGDLQDLFENLKSARKMPQSSAQQEGQELLNKLGEVMSRQQKLLDETFRKSREGNGDRPNNPSAQPEQGSAPPSENPNLSGMADRQEALRQMLGKIMGELGLKSEIPATLGDAERAMNSARQSLKQGAGQNAMQSQSDALQLLKDASEGLAERMQQQGQGGSVIGRGQSSGGRDPFGQKGALGEELLGKGLKIDGSDLSRARKIQQELHRRLSDPDRDRLERNYLERLIDQFR